MSCPTFEEGGSITRLSVKVCFGFIFFFELFVLGLIAPLLLDMLLDEG